MSKRKQLHGVTEKGNKQLRVRIYPDEIEALNNLRNLWNVAIENGTDPREVKHGWIKSKESSLFIKNHNYKEPDEIKIQNTFAKLLEEYKNYLPIYPIIERTRNNDNHLLVVSPADIHIGKLCTSFEVGEDYNSQIAVKRVKAGIDGIIDKASGFNIDKILLIVGNDILHTDNTKRTTTGGTPQDTDGMWYDNFRDAFQLYIDVIEKLVMVADIHIQFNPSNHDYISGFFVAQMLETHFRHSANISFNCDISHRKYFTYGFNLIGSTHGDGAKAQNLPLLMAHEAIEWSNCKHKYIYTHHVHHKISKDYMGVCVETLRSPSGTDSWHHKNGYQHAPKAIEAFLHNPIHGQVARLTHIF
jgi:hypothetical protein